MSSPTNAVTIQEPQPVKSPVAVGRSGVQLTTLDDMWRFSTAVSKSGLAPKGIESPEAILIAVQMGMEVGLTPMAALQNIAVINGRPTIWGDAQLAVCRGSGELEEFAEWYEENGQKLPRNPIEFKDGTAAVCRVKRKGSEPRETSFSVADAKRANLWGKQGPWTQYPARMLRFRARSFGLRDEFGDALKGIRTAEEVLDDPIAFAAPAHVTAVETKPVFARTAKVTPKAESPADAVASTVAPEQKDATESAPAAIVTARTAEDIKEATDLVGMILKNAARSVPPIVEADLVVTLAQLANIVSPEAETLSELSELVPLQTVRSWVKGWTAVSNIHAKRVGTAA